MERRAIGTATRLFINKTFNLMFPAYKSNIEAFFGLLSLIYYYNIFNTMLHSPGDLWSFKRVENANAPPIWAGL